MKRFHPVILGTILLTLSGILCRSIGFFYRIFLSNTIGEEGMGLYQLSFSAAAIFTALCCSGFQTALSRLTATAGGNVKQERRILRSGLVLSLVLSVLVSALLYRLAVPIASKLLMEERCAILLEYYALSLPFSAIHNTFNGSYLGRQKALLPALTQLFEQLIRVLTILILWKRALEQGSVLTSADAMLGLAVSELAVVLFYLPCYLVERNRRIRHSLPTQMQQFEALAGSITRKICQLAIPLIANRLVLTVLQSVETILIPGQLRAFGLSDSDALRTYGVFTGMVLPFLMFPASLTGSAATMTLPAIASAQSAGDQKQLHRLSHTTIAFSLWLGFFSAGIFRMYGSSIGQLVFHSASAGSYLQTLSLLCPFLYLSMTLNSIINGLGKPAVIFYQSIAALLVRLLSVLFLIPRMGIWGYFIGTFFSQSLICILHYHYLKKQLQLPFFFRDYLAAPILQVLTGCGLGLLASFLLSRIVPAAAPLLQLLAPLSVTGLYGLYAGIRFFRQVSVR